MSHSTVCEHGQLKRQCLICELTAALAAERQRREELLKAERRLSDAYLRIREKLGAWDTPEGPTAEQTWAHTEAKLDALAAQLDAARKALEEIRDYWWDEDGKESFMQAVKMREIATWALKTLPPAAAPGKDGRG